jgi:hypothetical protein
MVSIRTRVFSCNIDKAKRRGWHALARQPPILKGHVIVWLEGKCLIEVPNGIGPLLVGE